MNSTIISIPLNNNINNFLNVMFKDTSIPELLKENCWIAGGFARTIGRCQFNIEKESVEKVIYDYIFRSHGDIDIFTKSNVTYHKSSVILRQNRQDNVGVYPTYNHDYINTFSENFIFHSKKELYNIDHDMGIKMQLVNKFFYKSISDCFDAFDFTNCKFALQFKNNRFVIHYEADAVDFEEKNHLSLEHSNSPLLGKRIIKYLKKGLEFSDSSKNISVLKSFYYKVLTKNWDQVYLDNMDQYNFNVESLGITYLDDWVQMSKEDLILFVGKISVPEFEQYSNGGYGHYYAMTGSQDWALKLISER